MTDNTSTEAGETWTEMVRRVSEEYGLGPPSDDEADFVLWEKTAFPFAPPDHVERQVREFMERAVPAFDGV